MSVWGKKLKKKFKRGGLRGNALPHKIWSRREEKAKKGGNRPSKIEGNETIGIKIQNGDKIASFVHAIIKENLSKKRKKSGPDLKQRARSQWGWGLKWGVRGWGVRNGKEV